MTFDPPRHPGDASASGARDTDSASVEPVSEGWRSVVLVTWLLVFGCMTAIAISSRTTGRSIWWLGPTIEPAPVFFVAVPIGIVVAPMWAAMTRPRLVGRVGIVCSLLLALTALPDLSDRPGVAVMVLAVAFAALLSSVSVAHATRH